LKQIIMPTKTEIQVGRSDRVHLTVSRDRTNPESTIFVHLLDREDILIATARVYVAEDELQVGTVTRYSLKPANPTKPSIAQRILALLMWERADKLRKQLN
jgi:hypothetical protein